MLHRRVMAALVLSLAVASAVLAQGKADPADVARAVLSAYGSSDLETLAQLTAPRNRALIAEIVRDGEAHPRYPSLFGENSWRWRGVQDWDGKIRDVRYRGLADQPLAQVKFGELGSREALVVTLKWQDGAWWFEDINSPNQSDYQKLRTEP